MDVEKGFLAALTQHQCKDVWGLIHAFRLSLPSGSFHGQQLPGWHVIIVGPLDVGHVYVSSEEHSTDFGVWWLVIAS